MLAHYELALLLAQTARQLVNCKLNYYVPVYLCATFWHKNRNNNNNYYYYLLIVTK